MNYRERTREIEASGGRKWDLYIWDRPRNVKSGRSEGYQLDTNTTTCRRITLIKSLGMDGFAKIKTLKYTIKYMIIHTVDVMVLE